MTEPLLKFKEAAAAMNPIMRGWLWHGADIQLLLNRWEPTSEDAGRIEELADGCHEWGEMLIECGQLWWDARDELREVDYE